ncbi:MAG: acetolactate synthase small subunit [Thermotogae bacterium]|nr:acetolactate synthase small subunit [Thermotogota bacterium]
MKTSKRSLKEVISVESKLEDKNKNKHKHIVSILVYNKAGVLRKIAHLFARRGYNINSITVGKSEIPDLVRMIIVVEGEDNTIDQIEKQVYKVIEVYKVSPISSNIENRVEREMALVKVKFGGNRQEIYQLVEIFRGKIIDVGQEGIIIEITGATSKIEAFVDLISKSGKIVEIARTGITAMDRWDVSLK